jgi:type VI secretion system ImpC/EvpB family protein
MPDQTSHALVRFLLASIDQVLIVQTSLITQNESFQTLLSTWSSVYYLTKCSDQKSTKVKILDLARSEFCYLINGADEIDNIVSHKILDEQEMPGNEPLSLLLTSHMFDVSNTEDIAILNQLAQTCAYAFTPFIAGINAQVFDAADFTKLEYFSLKEIHTSNKFRGLINLAKQHYSNFLSLVIPKVYYSTIGSAAQDESHFLNIQIDSKKVILGSGAFATAAVIMQVFAETGWFLDMLGVPLQQKDKVRSFGAIPHLAQSSFQKGLQTFHTQFAISEIKEKELSDLGMIALCHMKEEDVLVLYSVQTLRNLYFTVSKETPIDKAHVLQTLLCVCRFAHYIRMIARRKTGEFLDAKSFENYLEQWLTKYVASNPDVDRDLKRKYPLLSAKVCVTENSFIKHRYRCAIYLRPHLLSSEVSTDILLTTNVATIK